MVLILVGLNHKTATIDLREKIAFNNEDIERIIKKRNKDIVKEELIISTCNRTEFYGYVKDINYYYNYLNELIKYYKDVDIKIPGNNFYIYKNIDVVKHLFEVASGIDSMIIGENQILGQIKAAYTVSIKAGGCSKVFNKLFHKAFEVGKKVRTETEISKGGVSISGAAVELLHDIFDNLEKPRILLVGLGETGTLVGQALIKKGVKKFWVSNRTASVSRRLASSIGIEKDIKIISFGDVVKSFKDFDVVISSTGADSYIFEWDNIKKVLSKIKKDITLIDLSVPRSFDPRIGKIKNVKLYSIDDLKVIGQKNQNKRKGEIIKAKKIIHEYVADFESWYGFKTAIPIIDALKEKIEKLRKEELEKNKSQFDDVIFEKIDRLTRSMVKKILKEPFLNLKLLNFESEEGLKKLELIKELFSLNGVIVDDRNQNWFKKR